MDYLLFGKNSSVSRMPKSNILISELKSELKKVSEYSAVITFNKRTFLTTKRPKKVQYLIMRSIQE